MIYDSASSIHLTPPLRLRGGREKKGKKEQEKQEKKEGHKTKKQKNKETPTN